MIDGTQMVVAFDSAFLTVGRGFVPIVAKNFFSSDTDFMGRSLVDIDDGAAAALGTLTNAPSAGNPTKWLPYDDNGVTRHIPAW